MVEMGTLVGSFRRFGLFGPSYEVLGRGAPSESGKLRMRVRLLGSGEEAGNSVEHILADPVED